jgi:hypothetical protein
MGVEMTNEMDNYKMGLMNAIGVARREADLADLIWPDDKRAQTIYRVACMNMVCMLEDEIEIQCGDK